MGDPSKAQNETFLQGTSTKDGVCVALGPPDPGPQPIDCFCKSADTYGSGLSAHQHLELWLHGQSHGLVLQRK